ncbi:MAG: hypothetical protein ABFR33_05575 [Verrucomicrobiota bacterium]
MSNVWSLWWEVERERPGDGDAWMVGEELGKANFGVAEELQKDACESGKH